ncbi:MAG: hypothetical protein JWN21_119 [Sphingomonas bacterium]|uniref:hypothetical protein n=1 Tax=Sphingomonas bacterium TaxID=1895847 RepID=UPI002617D735|nr:hypothetical protein [Sphingomonas bacterium]MDB5694576.1 hypothetical protein [Sphingomonas bacterium]
MLLTVLALQAAALPDIQLRAEVRAKSVTVEQRGTSRLSVYAEPDGGSTVQVQAPPTAAKLDNVVITIDAKARIATEAASASKQGE